MFVPEVAEAFQRAGITALTFDPRCTGLSDGLPRQELDPHQQVSDYSDALTFLASQQMVDPAGIVFWGFSYAATVALCAAALDKRASGVIAVAPLTDYTFSGKKAKVLVKAFKDRESQVNGNDPFEIPILTERGESVAGFGGAANQDNYKLIAAAFRNAPTYQNKTTIQTYYKIAMWQPLSLIPAVAPTPCFLLTGEEDTISLPTAQAELYETIDGPKFHHREPAKGHMDVLAGATFDRLMEMQVDFVVGKMA